MIGDLKPREVEALQLAAQGFTAPQMATLMHLSVSTVKVHLERARVKLGAANTTHAVAIFVTALYAETTVALQG